MKGSHELTRRDFFRIISAASAGLAVASCAPQPTSPSTLPSSEITVQPQPERYTDLEAKIDPSTRQLVLKDANGKTILAGPRIESFPSVGFGGGLATDLQTKQQFPYLYYDSGSRVEPNGKFSFITTSTGSGIKEISFPAGEGKELPQGTQDLWNVTAVNDQLLVQFWAFPDNSSATVINFTVDPKTGEKSRIPVLGEIVGLAGSSKIILDSNPVYSGKKVSVYDLKTKSTILLANEAITLGVSHQGEVLVVEKDGTVKIQNLNENAQDWEKLGRLDPNIEIFGRAAFTPDGQKILANGWVKDGTRFTLVIDKNTKVHHLIHSGTNEPTFSFNSQLKPNDYASEIKNDRVTNFGTAIINGKRMVAKTGTIYLIPEEKTGLYDNELFVGSLSHNLSLDTFIVTKSDGAKLQVVYRKDQVFPDPKSDWKKQVSVLAIVSPSDLEGRYGNIPAKKVSIKGRNPSANWTEFIDVREIRVLR